MNSFEINVVAARLAALIRTAVAEAAQAESEGESKAVVLENLDLRETHSEALNALCARIVEQDLVGKALGLPFAPLIDGRPCHMDQFHAALMRDCDDRYDRDDALKDWSEGRWEEALDYLEPESRAALLAQRS